MICKCIRSLVLFYVHIVMLLTSNNQNMARWQLSTSCHISKQKRNTCNDAAITNEHWDMKGGLDSNDCSACVVVVDEREITGFWIWREARGVWRQYILLVSSKRYPPCNCT